MRMPVHADLHVHTTNSDGTLDLDWLPDAARRAGLAAVAVTDHDRLHPGLDAPVVDRGGLTLIHGIELRVRADEPVDLLGYGVTQTPALRDEIDRLQRDRVDRGADIIQRVEDRLGIDLALEPRPGLGRPHIARAIADHPDTAYDVQGAFDHLIGDDAPCYVPRDLAAFDRGRRLLRDACALVALAHPFRYADPASALDLARDLDGVERYYPYDRDVDPAPVDRLLESTDLVAVGGSDTHDDHVGRCGLDKAAYRGVADRLDRPAT